MSVRKQQHTDGAIFFCTFTCWNWLQLIGITQAYDRVYAWMHSATRQGFSIVGYVIMPNHVHLLVHAPPGRSINLALGQAKQRLAYDILARLRARHEHGLLAKLQDAVTMAEAQRGQRHRVFATSSDIRACFNEEMFRQKLDYIHANPLAKHWTLAPAAADYPHSSAAFYERGATGPAPIKHFREVG